MKKYLLKILYQSKTEIMNQEMIKSMLYINIMIMKLLNYKNTHIYQRILIKSFLIMKDKMLKQWLMQKKYLIQIQKKRKLQNRNKKILMIYDIFTLNFRILKYIV